MLTSLHSHSNLQLNVGFHSHVSEGKNIFDLVATSCFYFGLSVVSGSIDNIAQIFDLIGLLYMIIGTQSFHSSTCSEHIVNEV